MSNTHQHIDEPINKCNRCVHTTNLSLYHKSKSKSKRKSKSNSKSNLFITTLIYLPFAVCRWFSSNAIESRLLNNFQWILCSYFEQGAIQQSIMHLFQVVLLKLNTPITNDLQSILFQVKGKNFNSWYPKCFFNPFWLLNSIYQPYML